VRRYYALFFVMVLTIPFLLGINAWQANECGKIKKEIRGLEADQEDLVEENKTVVAEISDLLAISRLETEAQKRLGLRKIHPENVTLIIMGGKGSGF